MASRASSISRQRASGQRASWRRLGRYARGAVHSAHPLNDRAAAVRSRPCSRRLSGGRSCSTTTVRYASSLGIPTLPCRHRRSARCSRSWPPSRRRACTSSAAALATHWRRGSATCRSRSAPSTATSCGRRAGTGASRSTSTSPGSPASSACSAGKPRTCRERWSSGRRRASHRHYREAEPEYGGWRARELLVALENVLAGSAAEVLPGRRVIEVRARGVNKGTYRREPPCRGQRGPVYLAAGDDVTDNDLFRALPDDAVAIHVGTVRRNSRRTPLRHEYVTDSPGALREALRELAASLRAGWAGPDTPGGAEARSRPAVRLRKSITSGL